MTNNEYPKNTRRILIILIILAALAIVCAGGYFVYAKFLKKTPDTSSSTNQNSTPVTDNNSNEQLAAYTLVPYTGEVFAAKIVEGWTVSDNESGIDVIDPADNNTGATGAIAAGWPGSQTPDSFIDYMLSAIGGTNVAYESSSDEGSVTDPMSNLTWVMKTKTFAFTSAKGVSIKAKASAGVLNSYGQFMAMIIAFQTTPDKWEKWAPTLERIAQSITIINTSKAAGLDKVRLPTAADLANDSSPIMEAWKYRNQVQDRASHGFSDAIMGQESGLVSSSTGRGYTLPLTSYDPKIGGYRNPDNSSEILINTYDK